MSIKIKESSSKNSKSLVYYSKYIEILLNEKCNWSSPSSQKKFAESNKSLYKLLETLLKNRNYEITGYDLMLMIQESNKSNKESEEFLLKIFRNIKEKVHDSLYLFDYTFDYEEDHQHHIYNDLFIEQEYNHHSVLMLSTKCNYVKIAKFLISYSIINIKVEAYNQYKKIYSNVHTYALDTRNYDLLTTLLKRDSDIFWKYMRHTPTSLYESIEDKSSPLIDTIVTSNLSEFSKNEIYMELAMGLNQNAVLKMIEYGEINPFYIDKASGNTALISATFTKNAVLFEKLMEMAPLWYVVFKNIDGKCAQDYLNVKSKKVINNYMIDRLHNFIKIHTEKPKVIIMNGKDTIYINPVRSPSPTFGESTLNKVY